MKKIKGFKRWLKLPTQNYILIWKLAKRITKLEQENRPSPSLPEGYEVIDNALLHPDGFIIAIEKRQKVTTVKTPIIVEIFMQKLDEVDARALAAFLQGARS